MYLPFGEKATDLTEEECPWKGFSTCSLVCASQSLIVLSEEPDTMFKVGVEGRLYYAVVMYYIQLTC